MEPRSIGDLERHTWRLVRCAGGDYSDGLVGGGKDRVGQESALRLHVLWVDEGAIRARVGYRNRDLEVLDAYEGFVILSFLYRTTGEADVKVIVSAEVDCCESTWELPRTHGQWAREVIVIQVPGSLDAEMWTEFRLTRGGNAVFQDIVLGTPTWIDES